MKFGWLPDPPDARDFYFRVQAPTPIKEQVDLRDQFPDVYNQMDIGSCVANACAGAVGYLKVQQKIPYPYYSRLFIYYNARSRKMEDTGTTVREACKCLNRYGVCLEDTWSYDTTKFTVCPPKECYAAGRDRQIVQYYRTRDYRQTLSAGYPIVFGMTLYNSFMEPRNGYIPVPNLTRERPEGGHCMLIVGYIPGFYIIRNSWGTSWGINGYCMIPSVMIENDDLCCDFWVIQGMEPGPAV